MSRRFAIGWSALYGVAFSVASLAGLAQQRVEVPRADGAKTPLMVYEPAHTESCPSLAVISPGAGGNEKGYSYLASFLAGQGWRAVVMGHEESGPGQLLNLMAHRGMTTGLWVMTTDPARYRARQADIQAALGWAAGKCHAPYRVLLGHSMGAATVMMEAGAKNKMGITGEDRFDAYVALSPQGPGSIFPDDAWGGIPKPTLVMTGTLDKGLEGTWQDRELSFYGLPPGCKLLGVVDAATHMNFAGVGAADGTKEDVRTTLKYFLAEAHSGRCAMPPPLKGVTYEMK